jgi:DNA transformation protein
MSEFTEFLHEVFELAGPITIRRMFSGHTLYLDGLPVGIVFDDTLYLKADAETRQAFEALQLPQFTYRKKDKTIALPYFQAPDFILEDRQEAALWLRKSFEASLRSKPKAKR